MRRTGATESDQRIDWLAGSAEELAFPDAAFDIALMVTVLEFVAEPSRAMTEAWRVLRAGGTLLVGHLDPLSPWTAHYRDLADNGIAPWSGARFLESEQIAKWLGRPAHGRASCVFLAPNAVPPLKPRTGPADGPETLGHSPYFTGGNQRDPGDRCHQSPWAAR
jgi:SAM-dependent methyltransferase